MCLGFVGPTRRLWACLIGVSCLPAYGVFFQGFALARPVIALPCLPVTSRWLLGLGFHSRLARAGYPARTEIVAIGITVRPEHGAFASCTPPMRLRVARTQGVLPSPLPDVSIPLFCWDLSLGR